MSDSLQFLKKRLEIIVEHMLDEGLQDYVLFALKKISDRQLLFISFDEFEIHDDPVLKMQDLISEELESEIYGSKDSFLSRDQLESILKWLLTKYFSKSEHVDSK